MNNSNPISFKPQSASDMLAREPQPIEWVWDKYIAQGDLFIFAAFMKVGKSTLIYPLVIAVARGIPFLGFKTKKGGVLILAVEEHPRDVELRLRKLGMTPDDPIYIHAGPLPNNEGELEAIRRFIQEKGISLVLIDSLPYWWSIKNENDNAEIIAALKPLLELARQTGAAVGLIHHESKYGGRDQWGGSHGDGKSIRGGSALFGIVDQAILLDRRHGGTRNQRVLKTIGRHSESPPELTIELEGNPALSDPNPYSYRNLGTSEELTKVGNAEKVLAVLTVERQDIEAIAKVSNINPKAVREAAEQLHNEGKVIREGKGVKGDPYTYRLEAPIEVTEHSFPDSFPGLSKPSLGKETNLALPGGKDSFLFQDGSIGGKEMKGNAPI